MVKVMVESSDTEERILDAAHAVFLRRGTAGARMQEVADEAGVNKALLHYYFRSKDRLARAMELLGSEATLEEKVRGIVALEVDVLRANPFLPGFVLSELTHHPERIRRLFETVLGTELGRMGERVRGRIGDQLAAGAEAGRLRPMTPEAFLMNLISMVIFPFAARPLLTVLMGVDDGEFDGLMARRKESLPEFFLNAMRP
jgi:TetR/AcrR family transcriptional regulator